MSYSSFFTKCNYSYDNRYLLEATMRTDGSSKFAPGNQWGFFPSASIGWNVHNESFMSSLNDSRTINDFKIRASWGRIGNENVDPYLWEEVVNTWGWTMINDADRIFLGDPAPHFNYSLSLDLRYKDWDFSLLGQGVGKRVGRLGGQEGFPVFPEKHR